MEPSKAWSNEVETSQNEPKAQLVNPGTVIPWETKWKHIHGEGKDSWRRVEILRSQKTKGGNLIMHQTFKSEAGMDTDILSHLWSPFSSSIKSRGSIFPGAFSLWDHPRLLLSLQISSSLSFSSHRSRYPSLSFCLLPLTTGAKFFWLEK